MNLCWIYPTTRIPELEGLWAAMEESTAKLLREDVTVEHRFLEHSGNFTRSFYAEHLNNVLMVEAAVQAQNDGFDGVLLGCWNNPLWQSREVLNIPVASVGEQSILTALTMGHRFAIATVSAKTAFSIEQDLIAFGLEARAIQNPVRHLEPESSNSLLLEAVDDPWSEAVPRFDSIAESCAADRAEVIIIGCTYFAAMLRRAGYTSTSHSQALVMDASAIALKQLESMVDTAKRTGYVKSSAGSLRTPESIHLDRQRHALGSVLSTDRKLPGERSQQ